MNSQICTLTTPELVVRITNFGARILSFEYQGTDCLYGPKSLEDLPADTCYCGSICGRVANRIAGGEFELDGVRYQLAVNNGPNHLHGGLTGFSDMPWTVEEATDSRLVLSLISPDGQENYPGTVTVRATYTVEGRRLNLLMEASTDAPTLLNHFKDGAPQALAFRFSSGKDTSPRWLSWICLSRDPHLVSALYLRYIEEKAKDGAFTIDFGTGAYGYKLGTFRPQISANFTFRASKTRFGRWRDLARMLVRHRGAW